MRKILPLVLVAAGATALFAWTVLNRNGEPANGSPLSYAPADTPYAMGLVEPFPDEVVQQWTAQMDPLIPLYAQQLRRAAAAMASDPGAGNTPRLLEALAAEIDGKSARDALAAAGLSPNARMALYGLGLVPVLRWELAAPDDFRAFVARLEQAAGQQVATASLAEQPYWRFPIPEAPIEGVAAVVGTHLVLSVAPANAQPEALQALLGLRAPDPSLLDSDVFDSLVETFGYQRSFLGFIDSGRLYTTLTGAATPLEQAFLAALDTQKPQLSEACREEYQQLAVNWPRASFGYTALDPSGMNMRAVLETAPDIAADLMTLRAPMPALDAIGPDTAFNFGVSLNLGALPTLVNKRAAAIEGAPYQCESLAWLNAGASQARTGINNPALFAMAPVFRGFHALVEDFALGPDMVPTAVSGALVIGSDNPKSLLAMAATAVPQVAALDLQPGGSVQPLDLPPIPNAPIDIPAWASMTDTLLGIGFGAGADKRLPAYMATDPGQQPLLVFGYSGRLYATIADIMDAAAANLPDPQAREEMELQAELMRGIYADWIARADLRLEFTDHGIELHQEMLTND